MRAKYQMTCCSQGRQFALVSRYLLDADLGEERLIEEPSRSMSQYPNLNPR